MTAEQQARDMLEIFDEAGELLVAVPVTLEKSGLRTGRATCTESGTANKYRLTLSDGPTLNGGVVRDGESGVNTNAFVMRPLDLRKGMPFEVMMNVTFPEQ